MEYAQLENKVGLHNQEAEMQIIGSLLNDNDNFWNIGSIEPKHFYFKIHREIFESIARGIRGGEIVSVSTLKNMYHDHYELLDVGGIQYILACTNIVTGFILPRSAAKFVIDLYKRRHVVDEIQDIHEKMKRPDGVDDIDVVLGDLLSLCMKYSGTGKSAKIHSYQKVTMDILTDMQDDSPSYSTGIPRLDKATQGGLHSRKNYCVAARPKQGKTVMLSTVATNMSMQGIPTLYICAEMGEKEIHQRVLARQANTNSMAFITKRKDAEFCEKVTGIANNQPTNCYYVDAPNISFQELQRVVMLAIKRYKIKGFFLDYLQLVSGKDKHENMVEHQEKVSMWIAQIVKQENIFCMYAAQRNREGSLRGGDAILMNVDQLYSLDFDNVAKTAYMEMEATRYTPRIDVGTKESPGLRLHKQGPFFSDIDEVLYDTKAAF